VLDLSGGFLYTASFMQVRKIHLKSFGCQMNKLDSSLVVSALTEQGYSLTEKAAEADVIVINTCSVREHAEERVFSHLGHIKHLKKSRPSLLVAVIGCMAQRLGDQLLAHEVVDVVAGPAQLHEVPALIDRAMADHNKHLAVSEEIRQPVTSEEVLSDSRELDDFEIAHDSDANHIKSQAFIRVMRGCNNFCTYCIVPYVRGPEVSRPPQAIVEQAKKLAAQGIQQITLLGQTVNQPPRPVRCLHSARHGRQSEGVPLSAHPRPERLGPRPQGNESGLHRTAVSRSDGSGPFNRAGHCDCGRFYRRLSRRNRG
jgi:tRNA-2-methylthio-N6-dimethylallyladenosine synthase